MADRSVPPVHRADLLPPRALLAIAKTLAADAKANGEEDWKKTHAREHFNAAMTASLQCLTDPSNLSLLEEVAARSLMALELMLTASTQPRQPADAVRKPAAKGELITAGVGENLGAETFKFDK